MPMCKANTSGIHTDWKSNVCSVEKGFLSLAMNIMGKKKSQAWKKEEIMKRKQLISLHFLSAKMEEDKQFMLSLSTTKFTRGENAKIIRWY